MNIRHYTGVGVLFVVLLVGLVVSSWGLPPDVNLTGMLAMWTHGTAVQIEYPERLPQVRRMAFYTRIVGSPNTSNWLHFPISTPVVGTFAIFGDEGGFLKDLQEIFVPEASLAIPDSVSWNLYFRRYHIDKVFLCFRTASANVRVISVHVYDGSRKLATFDNLNLYGTQDMREFVLPGCPAVHKGICVSLAVEFGDSGEQWIELESVGADFYFWEE